MQSFKRIACFKRTLLIALALIALGVGALLRPAPALAEEGPYVLEASALEAFAAEAKADGDTTEAAGFYTLLWSAKSKVDSSSKTWEDGYASGQRINFGGKATVSKNAVKFTTDGPAVVKIWWVQGGDDNREMGILNGDGEAVAQTSGEYAKNSPYYSELPLEEGGTYYLGGLTGNNYLFKLEVVTGAAEKPARKAWDSVAAPEIVSVKLAENDGNTVDVTVQAPVGYDGADKVSVMMVGEGGLLLDTKNSAAEKDEHLLSFTPGASGRYTFVAQALREGEEAHQAEASLVFDFLLPLQQPALKIAANAGGGAALLEWDPVPEAESYRIAAAGTDIALETADCAATVEGLTVGETYAFTVTALRGGEAAASAERLLTITEEKETAWAFSAFGTGVNTKTNGYEGSVKEGAVRVYSTEGKGKLVPGSTDGLAFYYTKIDPNTTNFSLTATANVNTWTYSNGQEGFGLMAADAVGVNGDNATFWNNSYMASVTKVEYYWDGEKAATAGDKISMRLGVGAQEKIGVTPENITPALTLSDMSVYSSVMTTLDTSCAALGPGTYNLVGNSANNPTGTVENPLTRFTLTLEKNNTGYFVSYTAPDGQTFTQKYYAPQALSHLDENGVYVGFFASRNADVTFTDISFTTSDPASDPPAEERPLALVIPSYSVVSAAIANQESYTLEFAANADGALTVENESREVLWAQPAAANEKQRIPVQLKAGKNAFTLTFTPDPDYKPSEFAVLSSYEPVQLTHSVDFTVNPAETVYVSPQGAGSGTREDPASLEKAVREAAPGQTILLLEGRYLLTERLTIERGISGSPEAPITLMAEPNAATRPVLDFGGNSAGIVLAGDYWHLLGFDVTGSKDGEKGIQVSGSHNVLENLETYKNGNTGLQISRYKGTDTREDWPADNLILNCTSYLNADHGYEDADGFAAKLTCGEGNVFDGCISCYNADDGWDLYAKIETGPIGMVTIRNSVAYKNGYVLDEAGNEINAGNGNGFKMGGESISGHHTLINSIAFANKSKGIDSNSCPDIQAQRCVSFNNESYNVAFYTNTAVNTDFAAQGVVSFKTSNDVGENIKLMGAQDAAKVYGPDNFYWENGASKNAEGLQVQADWFVSLDMDAAIHGGVTRNEDGTIQMNGFLELTDAAPENVGAQF